MKGWELVKEEYFNSKKEHQEEIENGFKEKFGEDIPVVSVSSGGVLIEHPVDTDQSIELTYYKGKWFYFGEEIESLYDILDIMFDAKEMVEKEAEKIINTMIANLHFTHKCLEEIGWNPSEEVKKDLSSHMKAYLEGWY